MGPFACSASKFSLSLPAALPVSPRGKGVSRCAILHFRTGFSWVQFGQSGVPRYWKRIFWRSVIVKVMLGALISVMEMYSMEMYFSLLCSSVLTAGKSGGDFASGSGSRI